MVACLTGVCCGHAAVHVEDVSGALARSLVGGEVQDGDRNVFGEDVYAERRPLPVMLLELYSGSMPYAAARSSRHDDPHIREPCSTASGFTVLTRMPSPPPSSARHRARCSSAAFADEYAEAVLARHQRVLGGDEHDRSARPLPSHDAERLARDEEVARGENRLVSIPL